MIVVSDTSPLTALLTVGAADILPQLFIVLLARRNRTIPSARGLIERLQQEAGMYLAEDIKEAALISVGE
jgi:predicted nucleic acid-binding protein